MKKRKQPPPPITAQCEPPVHVEGITYQHRLVLCGKERCKKGCAEGRPSHGPYWYAVIWNPKTGKTRTVYKGKHLPRLEHLLDQPEHQR